MESINYEKLTIFGKIKIKEKVLNMYIRFYEKKIIIDAQAFDGSWEDDTTYYLQINKIDGFSASMKKLNIFLQGAVLEFNWIVPVVAIDYFSNAIFSIQNKDFDEIKNMNSYKREVEEYEKLCGNKE